MWTFHFLQTHCPNPKLNSLEILILAKKVKLNTLLLKRECLFEMLALTYGPGPYGPGPYGPEALMIWKNVLSQICSRTIFEMHTALKAYCKHAHGAVCTQIMLLEHI